MDGFAVLFVDGYTLGQGRAVYLLTSNDTPMTHCQVHLVHSLYQASSSFASDAREYFWRRRPRSIWVRPKRGQLHDPRGSWGSSTHLAPDSHAISLSGF
jgi:hypothetical protein